LFALPNGELNTLKLEGSEKGLVLKNDPFQGKVKWQIKIMEIKN
jgi:hypothetical protein